MPPYNTRPMFNFTDPETDQEPLVQQSPHQTEWDNVGIMNNFSDPATVPSPSPHVELPVDLADINREFIMGAKQDEPNPNLDENNPLEVINEGYKLTEAFDKNVLPAPKIKPHAAEEIIKTNDAKALIEQTQDPLIKYQKSNQDKAEQYFKTLYPEGPSLNKRVSDMKKILGTDQQNDDTDLRALRLITDLFTLTSPFKGFGGAFHIMGQTVGREAERESAIRREKAKLNREIGLAAYEADNAYTENKLAAKAQFWIKAMGSDFEWDKMMAGQTHDFTLEQYKQQGKIWLEQLKKEGERIDGKPVNLAIKDESMPLGFKQGIGMTKVDKKGNITYSQYMGTDENHDPIYKALSVDNGFPIPPDSPLNEQIATQNNPGGKMMDMKLAFYSLKNSRDIIQKILVADLNRPKGGSYLGIEGAIDSAMQEGREIFINDLFGEIIGVGETNKFYDYLNEGYMNDIKTDFLPAESPANRSPVQPNEENGTGQMEVMVPGAKEGDPWVKKTVTIDMNQMLSYDYWNSITESGYDPTYAQNQVREHQLIYGLARALKPTGRLNVDDIKNSKKQINLTGFNSAAKVRAKLRAIDERLLAGQSAFAMAMGTTLKELSDQAARVTDDAGIVEMDILDVINQPLAQ